MRYLLDTHIILWWLEQPEKLSKKTRDVIQDRKNRIFLSSVSFWEMAIKQNIGRLKLPNNILEVLTAEGFDTIPLSPDEALSVAGLPQIHKDPFDRMLIMQAKLNDLVMITHDKTIAQYPVVTLN